MSNLTIRARLYVLGFAAAVAIAGVGAAGLWGFARMQHGAEEILGSGEALRNHMQADMMHDALRGDVQAALLASNEQEQADVGKDVAEHAETFRAAVKENESKDLAADVKAALAETKPALEAYIAAAESICSTAATDKKAAAARMPEFKAAFGELEDRMEKLSEMIERSAVAAKEDDLAATRSARTTMFVIGGLGLAVACAMAFAIARGISGALNACNTAMKQIAAGDLRVRVGYSKHDELGELASNCNQMTAQMGTVIGQVMSASREVAAAAEQISASSDLLSRGLGEQTSQVTQVAAAVDQMAASVSEVAKRSTDAAGAAESSGKLAQSGTEAVGQTVEGIEQIDRTVSASAQSVNTLGQRGQEIGRLVSVINDIAEQTNLLALNAAIEAARAGEHGRGFAVVADEVRKLADRTTKATDEIAVSIRSIQDETKAAVSQMKTGTESVRQGVERSTKAKEALEQIRSSSRDLGSMIQTIAAAAEEQASASGEIGRSVAKIAAISQESAAGVAEATQASRSLAEKAGQLRSMVERFKVEAGAPEGTVKSKSAKKQAVA